MKLTVAYRIIGGFSIITLMLVIMGASSLINLSDIEHDTTQAKDVSLPVLRISNKLQVRLLQLEELATREFYSADESTLNNLNQQILASNNSFSSLLSEIKPLTTNELQFQNIIRKIEDSNNQITSSTSHLFTSKRNQILLVTELTAALSKLHNNADDTSNLLLDIMDLEDEDQSSSLQTVIGLAVDLDSLLISIIKASEDLLLQTQQLKFTAIAKELRYLSNDLTSKMTFMLSRATGEVDRATLDDLILAFNQTIALLTGENSIISRQELLLQYLADSNTYSKQVITQVNSANQQLEQLLNLASQSAILSQQRIIKSVNSSEYQMYTRDHWKCSF